MFSPLNYQSDQRLALIVRGAVQGVGFRPFVYRLATELNLTGWVNNTAAGVFIEVEGNRDKLETFLNRLSLEKPPQSLIENIETQWLNTVGYQNFSIHQSIGGEKKYNCSARFSHLSRLFSRYF